jgi:hypothetical protein
MGVEPIHGRLEGDSSVRLSYSESIEAKVDSSLSSMAVRTPDFALRDLGGDLAPGTVIMDHRANAGDLSTTDMVKLKDHWI